MAAPVAIAYTHVQSVRLATGAEALLARVALEGGAHGFGFTLNMEAGVARDMAAWDALGRAKGVPLHALLGGAHRRSVRVARDEEPAIAPDWTALRKGIRENRYEILRLDPFAWGSVEMVHTIAAAAGAFDLDIALLAPNAHPWEVQYCAALAATLKGGDTGVIVRVAPAADRVPVGDAPGLGLDWSLEPAFAGLQWQG